MKCPVCKGDVTFVALTKLVYVWKEHKGQDELIETPYHLSCFLGDSHLSDLAGAANSFANNVIDHLRESKKKRSDKVNDLIADGNDLRMASVKYLEPDEGDDYE